MGNTGTRLDQALCRSNDIKKELAETHYHFLYKAFATENDIKFATLAGADGEIELPSRGGYVITNRISGSDDRLKYHVEFSKGATLLRHFHSDCDEILVNNSNTVFRIELGEGDNIRVKFLHPRGSITIFNNTKHQVTSLDNDGTLDVIFIKI